MARGPYEGTWQQGIRPTVVTAPDAVVYINGESEIIGCASCHRRFDFNRYITSIQVDLHVDSAPGSASINISIPRHSIDDFYFDGNPLITPMMEVEIFAKGFYLVEGLPQYYPIFWGMVTEVSDNYSGGEHSFSINCADILKWWELCKMNVNPAFTQGGGQLGRSIFGNVLFGSNPYDMIWTLAQQAFGDVVVGTGSLVSLYKEGQQQQTFNAALSDIMQYWERRFSKIRSNLLLYGTAGNAVRGDQLYARYQKQGGDKKFKNGQAVPYASQEVRQANGGADGSQMVFDPTSHEVTAFRTQFSQAGQVNFWSSEYQTKLEIANACKEAIGFEFYMDVTGDIVFKPPFYNLDILSNKPVSWIQDIDIIDWDLSESEAEVVTQIQLQGSFGGTVDYGMPEEATPFTSVTDYHLLRKYGWRSQTFNSEFSGDTQQMFYIGLDMLDRYNSKRFRGTVNIPMRPELRLGFPIYLAPKDQIWYVAGVSHNIQFGGRAQTTVSLTAKRSKFIAPKGIGTITLVGYSGSKGQPATPVPPLSPKTHNLTARQLARGGHFKANVGGAAQTPPINYQEKPGDDNPYEPLLLRHPKTGRIVGYPNVVMAYTRPFGEATIKPSPKELAKVTGRRDPDAKRPVAKRNDVKSQVDKNAPGAINKIIEASHTVSKEDELREKYLNNRYTYGLNSAGVYTYLHDRSSVLKEFILLPSQNIQFDETSNKVRLEGSSGMIRPVSDERGFEIIGHFRYGRGVSLRDGSLVLNVSAENPNAQNLRAEINPQLAISGSLFETLQAQSSGLTVQSTLIPNPAKAVTTLAPEDLQTAATINPETREPEFVHVGENFVQTAPLGSPEQAGVTNASSAANVEASQLSRALTLAEMAVKEAVSEQNECACLLGRSDLAFISVGYQFQVVGQGNDANATIKLGSLSEEVDLVANNDALTDLFLQQNVAIDAAVAEAQKLNEKDPLQDINRPEFDRVAANRLATARENALEKFRQDHAAEFAKIGSDEKAGLMAEAVRDGKPVTDNVFSHGQTILKIDQFLTTLYSALDKSHTEYEKIIRGESASAPRVNPENVRFGEESPKDLGKLAPPFGVPGRAVGGDPLAVAKQAGDAINQIHSSWNNFADKLASTAKKAKLQAEIEKLKLQASALQAKVGLAKQAASASPRGQPPTTSDQAALDKIQQQIANKQQELNILNQEFPP